jgi:2'-5' RNA ligase
VVTLLISSGFNNMCNCMNILKKRPASLIFALVYIFLSIFTGTFLTAGISNAEGSADGSVKGEEKGNAKARSTESSITAIDILLKPDDTMCKHALKDNAELLKNYPKGFALDASHNPHITLVQRYVKTADLDKVYNAASKVLAKEKPTTWKLEAFKYYYGKGGNTGLAGIVVKPTDDLRRLQQELIDAVSPFSLQEGSADAFVTTPTEPDIDKFTLDFVASFVTVASGKKFNPHVTTGIGTVEYLDKLVAEPFHAFTFYPVGVSVFQLGDYGTARKELKAL